MKKLTTYYFLLLTGLNVLFAYYLMFVTANYKVVIQDALEGQALPLYTERFCQYLWWPWVGVAVCVIGMMDACCSAMTERLDYGTYLLRWLPTDGSTFPQDLAGYQKLVDARRIDVLVPECQTFASAFGANAAYVGWAWFVHGPTAQAWTSEFLNNLKGGATVQEAYDEFLKLHNANYLSAASNERLMKLHGVAKARNTVIDKTTKKDNVP